MPPPKDGRKERAGRGAFAPRPARYPKTRPQKNRSLFARTADAIALELHARKADGRDFRQKPITKLLFDDAARQKGIAEPRRQKIFDLVGVIHLEGEHLPRGEEFAKIGADLFEGKVAHGARELSQLSFRHAAGEGVFIPPHQKDELVFKEGR
mgnify:CR=1 FL=1